MENKRQCTAARAYNACKRVCQKSMWEVKPALTLVTRACFAHAHALTPTYHHFITSCSIFTTVTEFGVTRQRQKSNKKKMHSTSKSITHTNATRERSPATFADSWRHYRYVLSTELQKEKKITQDGQNAKYLPLDCWMPSRRACLWRRRPVARPPPADRESSQRWLITRKKRNIYLWHGTVVL